ncbi:MAG TPA: LD-carboxypeptidase [Chitinophagaceae bacterium]|jgi:muramoyltetrapeptide carboxypeptidase|nr:LD-carboxypeptidase [Chitinophagaceae bacterium]
MSNIFPPYLKDGDTIGIVCPAGYMAAEKIIPCVNTLKSWGFRVKVGKTVGGNSTNYFSGTDSERLADLQEMLDDEKVAALIFGRGGYGLSRIIEQVSFKKFRKSPKWILGYSDISLLHAHIYTNYEIATVHSPMAGAFQEAGPDDPYLLSIRQLLAGGKLKYSCEPHPFNRKGEAEGVLMGGNLTLLAHAVGGPSDFKTKGLILFMEDIGEYIYNVDRMLHQLKAAGKFHKPAAVVIGSFTDLKDTERPFGQDAYEIIRDILQEYDFPVCYGFPVGHVRENVALKCGASYHLVIGKERVVLEEA